MFSKIIIASTVVLTSVVSAQTYQQWMSPDVASVWKLGYKGQGTTITIVDDYASNSFMGGNLDGVNRVGRHGQWTMFQTRLIAPLSTTQVQDFSNTREVPLAKGFNVINLSYGVMAQGGYSNISWIDRERSIIDHAKFGRAVVVKAAGNDGGVAVGATTSRGHLDYLNRDLIGARTAIFVGALNTNGTPTNKATRASYSNIPGNNPVVQNQFLMVGVETHKTGLAGTSFAAPVISGYAAVLGSKFNRATPTQITNQLLTTARKDTIAGYSASQHGRGEASLSRALAPVSIK